MAFPFVGAPRKRAPSPPRPMLAGGPVWAFAAAWRAVRHWRAWWLRRRGKSGAPPVVAATAGLIAVFVLLLFLRFSTEALLSPTLDTFQESDAFETISVAPPLNLTMGARSLVADFALPPIVAMAIPESQVARLLTKLALVREVGVHQPRLFVIHVQNGLGNRLRALSSGLSIARRLHRVPLVVWEPDAHLSARFGDILEAHAPRSPSGMEQVSTALYTDLVVVDTFPPWSDIMHRDGNWRPFNYMVKDGPMARQGETMYFSPHRVHCPRRTFMDRLLMRGCFQPADDIKPHQHVYFKSAYVASAAPGSLSSSGAVNAEMRRLRPVPEVLSIVRRYYPAHVQYVYGAHVRSRVIKTDGVQVNENCEYTADAEEMTDFWRSKSQLSEFLNLLHYLLKKYHQLHFFVAADDVALLKKASNAFPGRVHYIPRDCDDRQPECVRYAFADLLSLAKTGRIYGSNWSSFTEAAGRLANRRPWLSGVHFGKDKGKDQNYRNRFFRTIRTWKVRISRGLTWKTRCPTKR